MTDWLTIALNLGEAIMCIFAVIGMVATGAMIARMMREREVG